MPLCVCGHEDHEHVLHEDSCNRCVECSGYIERRDYARSTSFTDLPVSQGARDLSHAILSRMNAEDSPLDTPDSFWSHDAVLDILAEADPKDVRSLLWARRTGKL